MFGGGKSLPLATKSTLPTLECASSVSPLVKNGRKLFSVAFSARGRTLCARRRSPAAVGNSIQVAGRVAPLRIPMETKNSQQLRIISKRVPPYRFFPRLVEKLIDPFPTTGFPVMARVLFFRSFLAQCLVICVYRTRESWPSLYTVSHNGRKTKEQKEGKWIGWRRGEGERER